MSGGNERLQEFGAGGSHTGAPATAYSPAARLLAVFAIVTVVWLVAASRWIAADAVVPWDSKNQFYAFFRFLAATLQAGDLPFWNPYHYGGHPSIADPQSLVFAPAFVVWAMFDPAPSIRTFDLLVYAHLLAGALAVATIGWRAQWPAAACVLAALVFMLGGAASGRLQHTGIILSYGLFPVALLLMQLALADRSHLYGMLFAFAAAAMALGRNQVALLLCFVLLAAALAEIASAARPLQYLRERLAVLATMATGSILLVVVPVLLTVQFAILSNRPDVTLDSALRGSLHPANLATLLFANVFGSHRIDYWGPGWRMPEIQFTDQSFNYLFVGAVPVLLLLWIGLVGGGMWRRGRRMLLGILVVSLLYMLGRYTPFFALAFEWIPGANLFRRPVDGSFVFLIALSLSAGAMLADYVREGPPRWHGLRGLIAIAGLTAVIVAAFAFSRRFGEGRAGLAAMVENAQVAVLALIILVLAVGMRARSVAAILLTAIAAGELLYWNAASRLNAESRDIYAVLERPAGQDREAIDLLDAEIARRRKAGDYPRVEIMGVGGPWQNLAMVRGWEGTNGYNPLRIGRYDRLVAPGEATFAPSLRMFPKSFDNYDCALARALGLEYVVLDRPIEQVPRLVRNPAAETVLAGPKIWIYRLRNTLPRVGMMSRFQVADADAMGEQGQLLHAPSADRVLVDDETPPTRSYGLDYAAGSGRAHIVSSRPGHIEIVAESSLGGVLVLHATHYPGWVAEIDGKEAPLLRADVLFQGVEVPPGRHVVVFRFAPLSAANLVDAARLVWSRR